MKNIQTKICCCLGLVSLFSASVCLAAGLTLSQRVCKDDLEIEMKSDVADATMNIKMEGNKVIANIEFTIKPPDTISFTRAALFADGVGMHSFIICDENYNRIPWTGAFLDTRSEDGNRMPPNDLEPIVLKPGDTYRMSVPLNEFYEFPKKWKKIYVLFIRTVFVVHAEFSKPLVTPTPTPKITPKQAVTPKPSATATVKP